MGNKQKLSLSNLTMILRTFPMAGEKQKTPNRLTYSEFFGSIIYFGALK